MPRWFREPLLHFLVLGGLLFAVDAWRRGHDSDHIIRIDPSLERRLEQDLQSRRGRAPTPQELERALAQWKLEEAAYREGLRLRLAANSPEIRAILIQRVREMRARASEPPEPSARDLDAWLAAHRDLYETPRSYDFEQLFADTRHDRPKARARAEAWLVDRRAGKPVAALGDASPLGSSVQGLSLPRMTSLLGQAFADRVPQLPLDEWQLVESTQGFHVLRLTAQHPGGLPPEPELRQRLTLAWKLAARTRVADESLAALAREYHFVEN